MNEARIVKLLKKNFASETFNFDELALKVFAYQFEHNKVFQALCKEAGKTPKNVSRVEDIPLVPLDLYKHAYVASFPREKTTRVFCSTGTSGNRCSLHFVNTAAFNLYRRFTIQQFFSIVPELKGKKYTVIASTRAHPNGFVSSKLSSLYGILAEYGQKDFFIPSNFKEFGTTEAVIDFLRTLPPKKYPTVVCLNRYNDIAYLAAYCAKKRISINLPKGSFLVTGGGSKTSDIIAPKELYKMGKKIFGLSADSMIDSFSGTELSGRSLRRGVGGHRIPPWWRVETRDPKTLALLPPGETGLINITDILNFNNASFLLLPDSAYVRDGYLFHQGRTESPGYTKLLKKRIRLARKD